MTIIYTVQKLTAEIEAATPRELDDGIELCAQIADDQSYRPTERLVVRGIANLLRLYKRKYATVRQYASKSEQRRVEHQIRSKRP